MDCSPPGSSIQGDSLGKNTGVGCRALLQGIFPTQETNPGLAGHLAKYWALRDYLEMLPEFWKFVDEENVQINTMYSGK